MNKILVSIQIPSIEQNFDLFIPINKKVGTIKRYVVSSMNKLSKGLFNDTHHYMFFDVDTGVKYSNNVYVKDSGMKIGLKNALIHLKEYGLVMVLMINLL